MFRWRAKIAGVTLLLCAFAQFIRAGDAIAVGYNYAGIWTALTYNRSSTPKGGAHYHDAQHACQFALRDLSIRASEELVRTKIIGQSDRTGYVTVARGRAFEPQEKDVTAIGRGNSQDDADSNAVKKLDDDKATTNQEIVYRYFSYGDDSAFRSPNPKKVKKRGR